MTEHIESIVMRIVQQYMLGRITERHALVSSYDPDKHLAKVTFMPDGQESGWLPIETGHIGDGYGVAFGLQPGDGKSTGDQVIVRYQDGDLESGKIVQRVHSDDQKPPKVESGEMVLWARFQQSDGGSESAQGAQGGTGQQLFFKQDGSFVLTDGNGATIKGDGNGNLLLDCKTLTAIAQNDAGIKGGGNVQLVAGGKTGLDGAKVIVGGGGNVSDGSVTPPADQAVIPPFEVPG